MGKHGLPNNIDLSLVSAILSIVVVVGGIIVALTGDFGVFKVIVMPIKPTQTDVTFYATTTKAALTAVLNTPTLSLTATPSLEDQLVQQIGAYYVCLNSANPNNDDNYETCWNLLSNRPGEIQSNLDKDDYKTFWRKYKITYSLYYCLKDQRNYVQAKYDLYDRTDLSRPIGNGNPFYLEWSFALDENGWRIKGTNSSIKEISPYCESRPRLESLAIMP